MVNFVWSLIAFSLGLLIYLAIPITALALPIEYRERIGTKYLTSAARLLKQWTFVRRILSGYDIMPIEVDDEQKLLKVALTSSRLKGTNHYPFKDPDNRIKRLFNKPVALAYEQVPAAVDASLAEVGHAVNEKATTSGLVKHDHDTDKETLVDPYVPLRSGLHLVDPVDVYHVVTNDVDPENVKTTEQLTKKRFEKYGSGVGAAEIMTGALGYAIGIGSIIAFQYVQVNLLDGGGGGGGAPSPPIPLSLAGHAVDLGVYLV